MADTRFGFEGGIDETDIPPRLSKISAPEIRLLSDELFKQDAIRAKSPSRGSQYFSPNWADAQGNVPEGLSSDAGIQGTAKALEEELARQSWRFSDKYPPSAFADRLKEEAAQAYPSVMSPPISRFDARTGLQQVPSPLLGAIYDFLSNQGGPTKR